MANKKHPTIFDDLAQGANNRSYVPRTLEAQDYYRRKARSLRGLTPKKMIADAQSDHVVSHIGSSNNVVGQMVLFQYDPKTKDKMPYYDRFPLVFILKPLSDGFLGLNFHYLSYRWRGILLNRLQLLATNKSYDETTRLRLTYQLLNNSARFKPFKPCLKRYLNSQMRSRYLWIPSYDWEIAVFLPVQKFVGASNQEVWGDSRRSFQR